MTDTLNLPSLKQNIVNLDEAKKLQSSVTFENSNGKTRTFSVNEDRDVLPYIDLEGAITIDLDGHPNFDSIESAVHDILVKDNLLKTLDGKN